MISKKMKYALKALIEIVNSKEEYIAAHTIAEKANVPIKFLEQILNELRKGRIVNSKKGSFGGYYMLKEPAQVTLADVSRLIEGPIALLPCGSLNFYERCDDCPNEDTCQVHKAVVQVRDKTLKVLEKITLKSMASGRF